MDEQAARDCTLTRIARPIVCYNCGEKNHIAPNCPHPKIPKIKSQRPTAQGKAATSLSTNNSDDGTALVCSTRVINFANNTNDIHLEHDNSTKPTIFPNI